MELLDVLGYIVDTCLCFLVGSIAILLGVLASMVTACLRGDSDYLEEQLAEEEWRVWNEAAEAWNDDLGLPAW